MTLSPCGRGTRYHSTWHQRLSGPIPAWAGEPRWPILASILARAYPRVGGGTMLTAFGGGWDLGLSPRGRGNLEISRSNRNASGPIPAWAGEPSSQSASREIAAAYPRVGGGTYFVPSVVYRETGLSPRGRGNPAPGRGDFRYGGPIPAWAGEPDYPGSNPSRRRAYPRVGGGTAVKYMACSLKLGLSPRGRGNRTPRSAHIAMGGPIPAWAGEPNSLAAIFDRLGAYPRVGGGNPRADRAWALDFGPIPAWAGEPDSASRDSGRNRAYPRVGGGTLRSKTKTEPVQGLSPRGRGNPDRKRRAHG